MFKLTFSSLLVPALTLLVYIPGTRMNLCSFVSRLPTETLEAIFIEGAHAHFKEHGGNHTPNVPSWVNVSYVCRHWRYVALNSSTLWTYLFITSPRWTEELLSRSKQAPLKLWASVIYREGMSPERRFLDQAIDHVERIEEVILEIDLFGFGDDEDEPYPGILLSHAPRLRHLKIQRSPLFQEEDEWPLVPFDGGTSFLRTLELTGCPVAWRSFELSRLTILNLEFVPLQVQIQPSMEDFVATLSCMQDLREIYFDHALPSAASFPLGVASDTPQKIVLPQLSCLSITESIPKIIAFLSCVSIPSKTQIRLRLHYEPDSSYDDHVFLSPLLSQRFHISGDHAPSTPTIRFLVIEERNSLSFSTLTWDALRTTPFKNFIDTVPLFISFAFQLSMTTIIKERIMGDICCCMALTSVQSFHAASPSISSAFWSRILGHLRNLRHLSLSRGAMPNLASILSPIPRDDAKNEGEVGLQTPARLLVPDLEVLVLSEMTFSCPTDSENDAPLPSLEVLHALYNVLSSRERFWDHIRMVRCVVAPRLSMDAIATWGDGSLDLRNVVFRCDSEPEDGGTDANSMLQDGPAT